MLLYSAILIEMPLLCDCRRPTLLYELWFDCWATKTWEDAKVHVGDMRMLRWMCGLTRKDRIRNENIRGNL